MDFVRNTVLFTRGPLGLMALLGLSAQVFDYSRHPVVRALHAVIVDWNNLMGWLGSWIALPLPFSLGPGDMNALALTVALFLPPFIMVISRVVSKASRLPVSMRVVAFPLIAVIAAIVPLAVWLAVGFAASGGIAVDGVSRWLRYSFIGLCIGYLALMPVYVAKGFRQMPWFRRGIITSLTALALVEVAYFSPVIGDALHGYADRVLGPA